MLESPDKALKKITEEGGKILFVGKKKQVKEILEQAAKRLGQPYITLRWLGGTLTNFTIIRRLLKNIQEKREHGHDEHYAYLTKRERLMSERKFAKQERILGGLSKINRLPSALFVVDVKKEMTAVKEARKMGIPVIAIVDSMASPKWVDLAIPGNDDARSSVQILVSYLAGKMEEGIKIWEQKKLEQLD